MFLLGAQSIKAYTRFDLHVKKKSHCPFANEVEREYSKRTFANSLSSLGAQNKDLGTASQTLLTGDKLLLRCRRNENPQKKTSSLEKHDVYKASACFAAFNIFACFDLFFLCLLALFLFTEFNCSHFCLGCFIPVCNIWFTDALVLSREKFHWFHTVLCRCLFTLFPCNLHYMSASFSRRVQLFYRHAV